MKKTSGNIWKLCFKVLTFAPAFENESSASWHSSFKKRCLVLLPFSFCLPFDKRDDEEREKRKNKKNFRKYLEDMLKSSYLCIRFLKRKSDSKRSDLWIIYINNTSSTRARLLSEMINLGYKKRTVKWLIYIGNLKTFNKPSVLNRARTGSNTD